MVRKKSGSHRQSLKQKYKVQRKVKEFKKRMRKEARQNGGLHKSKLKKDPGIPNLWPFKEALLDKLAQDKEKDEALRASQKEKRQKAVEKRRRQAAARANEEAAFFTKAKANTGDVAKKSWYFKEMKQVVEAADIILEVLDARDPMGCRCPQVEKMIQAQMNKDGGSSKRLVLVMNKIDLVPEEASAAWIKHLRREFPTIAFKASTQQQRGQLGQSRQKFKADSSHDNKLNQSGSVGAGALLQLLKNYSRSLKIKKSINVGIIGYPNVGKSSLINSLKRSRAVGVSATPGFTKEVQLVKLDKQISLVDSPGVLFSAVEEEEDKGLFLRNCVRVEQISDPIGAVEHIVSRCDSEALMQIYKIARYSNAQEFLYNVAHARGKLGKGGVPNLTLAARSIIQDWNDGKIPYYTPPPTSTDVLSSEVVSTFSKEFDIGALLRQNDDEVSQVKMDSDEHVKFLRLAQQDASASSSMLDDEAGEGEAQEEETPAPIKIQLKSKKKKKSRAGEEEVGPSIQAADDNNQQRNKNLKKAQKKAAKERRRRASVADNSMATDDAYSFETDYTM